MVRSRREWGTKDGAVRLPSSDTTRCEDTPFGSRYRRLVVVGHRMGHGTAQHRGGARREPDQPGYVLYTRGGAHEIRKLILCDCLDKVDIWHCLYSAYIACRAVYIFAIER